MSIQVWSTLASGAGVAALLSIGVVTQQLIARVLKKESDSESERLRGIIVSSGGSGSVYTVGGDVKANSSSSIPLAGTQRIDDDRFAELLIEYYAWGLTQARRSTALSLTCSGLGVLVILGGVTLGIWRAETSGDLYASAATSAAGVVSTVIGHLAHRRADAAMKHMQAQTESLRQDMQREREVEASIRLLREVEEKPLRSQLQAALVLKLAGAELPALPSHGVMPPQPRSSRNGATAV
ncbi:hypothetical protein ABT236_05125 [Streptomyces sp. NPDC001523]|uniref:TRADD-N-associated membrane domain-containing protein n=1 Tax=Streptomyces sp. NPDC001523 TaxID=3154383 RepID=UPI0033268E46